jgi:hypothetical protein
MRVLLLQNPVISWFLQRFGLEGIKTFYLYRSDGSGQKPGTGSTASLQKLTGQGAEQEKKEPFATVPSFKKYPLFI